MRGSLAAPSRGAPRCRAVRIAWCAHPLDFAASLTDSLTFVGYGDEASTAVLELTYNYGVTSYELGSAFGHIAIGVDDAAATCAAVSAAGYTVSRPAGPVLGGTTVIAFVVDPDGYKVELIEGRDTD